MARLQTIEAAERAGRGWLTPDNCPPCNVWLDGRLLRYVVAVNRRRGAVRLHDDPPKIHKHGKRFIVRTRRGRVAVEMI